MKRNRIIALVLALTMVLGTASMAAEYTVVKGDTLSKIALSQLGSASRWKEIWEANKDTIKDPNKIVVGQKLTIPGGETEPEPAPAGQSATATAPGFEEGEVVTVTVTVDGGKIVSVVAESNHESEFGQRAIKLTPKAMVEQNTVNVDTCTGATTTSTAIINAARKAMAQLTEQNAAMDLDAWALANGYVKAEDYSLDTSLDAITGASEAIDASLQLTQKQIRALALDYLRGWPLKTDENGNTVYSYREMYQIATSYNNVPGLSSVEFVLDPTTMKLYASSEKGTEKCEHIKKNPNVVMYWYHQIPEEEYVAYSNDYFNSYGVQIKGTAKIMDPASEEAIHAADLYIETLYGAEAWNSRDQESKDKTIALLLKVNDWIEIDPTEYIVNSLLWRYNKEGSARPEYYDPDSPFYGKSVRQVYYVTGETITDVYIPGTYTGEAKGYGGTVTATVTVDADSIVDVKLTGPDESEGYGAKALPVLEASAKAKGDQLDAVSYASHTSAAAKNAVSAALALARGQGRGAKTPVRDGTYRASAVGFSWVGMVTADVTISGGKVTAIDVVEESETVTGELFGMVKSTYIPRLIESQSLAVDAVAGATSSSKAIESIVADAIDQAGGKSGEWYTPVEKKTDTVTIEDYDVIVVGMGGSGMLSFMAAADQGAKVIGLEKGGKLGGNSTTTTGPMALNIKTLMTDGKDYVNPDTLYDTWIEYVEGNKEQIVHDAVYTNKEALEYYIDNFDFEFAGLIMSFANPVAWPQLWTRYVNDPDTAAANKLGPNKTYMYQRAVDKAIEMSPGSQYMLETTVTEMITDAEGNVIGVKAVNVDGTTYEVYGKTVILATGGFIANTEMMLDTFGYTTQTLGCTLCTGDGINLGKSVGGATYALDVLPMIHIEQVPNLIKNNDLTGEEKAILSALALDKTHKAVNVNGEDYSRAATAAECYVPGYRYYNIYTQAEIDAIKTSGLTEAQTKNTSFFLAQGTLPAAGTPVTTIDTILAVGEQYGNVISGSIADLAKGIGCDEATLKTALGEDGKYYAVICAGYAYATVGGLDIDENMNVLKEDGTPIPNLFAVGQDSEGVCNIGQKAYSPWGGQAQSWTFTSGKIAGTQAAAVAAGK